VRGKPGDKLMLVRGAAGGEAPAVKAAGGGAGAHGFVQGATALKGDPRDEPGGREPAPLTMGAAAPVAEGAPDRRAEARMKGYTGEACPECGNFTMVRNGTCLKCDTCGSTTGCS
jgi:ribonucleoside-diphosphate reductase alpha chain